LGTRKEGMESPSLKFLLGGLSCCIAALFTNPIDVVKVRLQLRGELSTAMNAGSPFRFISLMVRDEGLSAFFKGLAASLLREATYSTIRMGGYEVCKTYLGALDPSSAPLWKKITSGAIAGAVGAAIANPTDLVKVRMQADTGKCPSGKGPRYKNTWSAFKAIYLSEGPAGFFRVPVSSLEFIHQLLTKSWFVFKGHWSNHPESSLANGSTAFILRPHQTTDVSLSLDKRG